MKTREGIKRIHQLQLPKNRSAFLWGPRKTGKTTLLKQQFPGAFWIDFPITFWRTASGAEVDLILGDADAAIEIKSSEMVGDRPKGLHLFLEEEKCRKAFIVSKEPLPRKLDSNITVLPWQRFCAMLWAGDII